MAIYPFIVALHVIVAVGGLGQLSVLGIMARKQEYANHELMLRIFKAVGGSLVIMLITGIAMLWMTAWVYEHGWWFRISFLLYIALGALHGIGQSTLRKLGATTDPQQTSILSGKLKTITTIMSLLLIIIVYLMEAKPF